MALVKSERRSMWPLEDRFDELVRSVFPAREGMMGRLAEATQNLMRIEEYVEDGSCVIRAELPGIDIEKDVEITVADGVLHIHAEREERSEDKQDGYRSEFRYGRFERTVRLPKGTSEADITATYRDGILEVRVPMPEETEPTRARIPIQHG
jgi:HSP20 family protein